MLDISRPLQRVLLQSVAAVAPRGLWADVQHVFDHYTNEMIMSQAVSIHAKRAIVVDHDAATTDLIAELLTSEGYAPVCCAVWPINLAFIEQAQAQLLVLEFGLGDPSAALDLLSELRQNPHTCALPVIVNSTDDRLLERLAEPLRALDCVVLAKPFDLDDFYSLISLCLEAGHSQTQRLAC